MPNNQWTTTTPELQPNVITPTPRIDPQPRSPILSPTHLFQTQEFDTMKSTTDIQTYLDLEGHKEQTPNRNPTALDVYSHMRFLGKELSLAGTRVELGGYAFIIDTLTEWRHRIGDTTTNLPTKPILPNKPNNSITGEWKRCEIMEKELKEFNVINKHALKYIQAKFPTTWKIPSMAACLVISPQEKHTTTCWAVSLINEPNARYLSRSRNKWPAWTTPQTV
jgi:hypothetical protein